jgi:hypothetical protein
MAPVLQVNQAPSIACSVSYTFSVLVAHENIGEQLNHNVWHARVYHKISQLIFLKTAPHYYKVSMNFI